MIFRFDVLKLICFFDWKFFQDENYVRDVDIVNNDV